MKRQQITFDIPQTLDLMTNIVRKPEGYIFETLNDDDIFCRCQLLATSYQTNDFLIIGEDGTQDNVQSIFISEVGDNPALDAIKDVLEFIDLTRSNGDLNDSVDTLIDKLENTEKLLVNSNG